MTFKNTIDNLEYIAYKIKDVAWDFFDLYVESPVIEIPTNIVLSVIGLNVLEYLKIVPEINDIEFSIALFVIEVLYTSGKYGLRKLSKSDQRNKSKIEKMVSEFKKRDS